MRAAFALIDVMAGMAVLVVISASVLWALTSSARLAAVSRNYTAAQAVAQKQIDEVLYANYRPPSNIPAILTAGATSSAVTITDGPPAITGKLTTTVSVADAALKIRRVSVVVNYDYRGKNHSVAMSTARAPD